ncbi:MAG: glycosyltransferase family 9 protein [Armatimonadetes bacterium]|nr:glycosyltransferase family 9 protein [Armatimonadota bacterium]
MVRAIDAAASAKRILIIKSSSLGDICNGLPVADILRQHKPDAHIGWVVKKPFRPIIDANPYVDKVWSFPRGSLWGAIKLGLEIRKHKYEVCLDMQSLFVSGLIAKLSGARYRISYDSRKEGSHLFNNYPIIPSKMRDRKAVEVMLDFPRALGLPNPDFRPQEWLGRARRSEANALLAIVPKPFAALFVGATTPQRQWSQERWGALADQLAASGLTPVFVGGPSDQVATVSARAEMKLASYSLVGKTDLLNLAAVIGLADVAIGGDSGPLHMAVAVGTPVVGLYGPTDPETTGPYGPSAKTMYIKQPCSPCYRNPTCGGAYFCMAAIEVAAVVREVQQIRELEENR